MNFIKYPVDRRDAMLRELRSLWVHVVGWDERMNGRRATAEISGRTVKTSCLNVSIYLYLLGNKSAPLGE